MQLCKLEDVKHVLGIEVSETDYDDELNGLIDAVSAEAERYMGRNAETKSYTEYFNVEVDSEVFQLSAFPLSSVSHIYNDPDWEYGDDSEVSTDYFKADNDKGQIYINKYVLVEGWQALKVEYTGGMGSDTTAFKSSFPDIANALARQVAFYFKSKRHVGETAINAQTGSISFISSSKWLTETRSVLDTYKIPKM